MTEAEVADLQQQLESRSLLGFQLDASHLHDVLQGIVRAIGHNAAAGGRRWGAIEAAITDLDARVSKLEDALGDTQEARDLRSELRSLGSAVDNILRDKLPEVRRAADEGRAAAQQAERQAQQAAAALRPIEERQQRMQHDVEGLGRNVTQVARDNEEHQRSRRDNDQGLRRELNDKLAQIDRELAEAHATLQRQQQQFNSGSTDGRWREAVDELNARMNENFRLIESGANDVDVELGKLRTELANLRAEVNTLDNNTRYRFGKVTDDVDEKFKMLLETLRAFENTNSQMEEALATAGKALAKQRIHRQTAFGVPGSSHGSAYGGTDADARSSNQYRGY